MCVSRDLNVNDFQSFDFVVYTTVRSEKKTIKITRLDNKKVWVRLCILLDVAHQLKIQMQWAILIIFIGYTAYAHLFTYL